MPTISQLPAATAVNATDEVPISQNGTVVSATVRQLLASTQPAITLPDVGLLGQPNPGPGAPVPVGVGQGVTIANGSLSANGLDHLGFAVQPALSLDDEVIVNASGTPSRLPITQLFSLYSAGENTTIDPNGTISAQGGPAGPAGPVGASLQVGDGAPARTLGAAGDSYIDAAAGELYLNAAGTWTAVGSLVGPVGAMGPAGPAGPVGAIGPTGPAGPTGPMGPVGAAGPAGPAGEAGTAFLAGSGTPAASLGSDGDTYLDTQAGNLYVRNQGGWTESGNIVGPAGPAGAAGSDVTIGNLQVVGSIAPGDLVGISLSGTDHAITYANFLDGQTIDELTAAAAVADTDSLTVGQGGSTLLRQTFAAVWTWLSAKLPTYTLPVIELTADTTLNGLQHNGRILVCSLPLTVTANAPGMGSGFVCDLVNVAGGPIALSGIATSSGTPSIAAGQSARIYVATYSGGTLVYAAVFAASGPSGVPGQVAGLSVTAATSNSVTLSWGVPAGPLPTSYVVQYRVSGTTAWSTQAASNTVCIIANLLASTAYDVTVTAANAAGQGAVSALLRATTEATPIPVPGAVTGLTIGTPSATSVPLTWTAPPGAAAQTVQYRVTGTSVWSTASSTLSAGATTFAITGLTASTDYDVQVFGTNASGAGPAELASGIATSASSSGSGSGSGSSGTNGGSGSGGSSGSGSANYQIASGYLPASQGTTYAAGSTIASANVIDGTASADGSHTAPAAIYCGWTQSATQGPTSTTGLTLMNGGPFANGGHNYQTVFSVPAPSSAGTYYFWCMATNAAGAIVSSCVQATAVGGSTPQPFTITAAGSSGSGSSGSGSSGSGSSGSGSSGSGSSGSGSSGSGSSGSGSSGSGSSGSASSGSGSSGSSGNGSSGSGSGSAGSPPGPLAFTYIAGSGTGVVASQIIGLFGGAANMQTPLAHGSSVTPSITWQQVGSAASVVWWFDTDPNNTSKTASTVASGTINTDAGANSGAVFFYGGNAPATAGTYYGKMAFYDSSSNLLGVFVTQSITVT